MKLLKCLIITQFTILLMSCSSDTSSFSKNQVSKEEKGLVDKFMGKWFSIDDTQTFIELKDNIEIVGVEESDMYSEGEFTIEEINVPKQYIVIHIFIEEISEENDDHVKDEYRNKLELLENGNKLRYNLDYKNKNIQSEWIRK
ncbi:hypothetical protein [Cohnella soli]|uniref:Lipoprotein n=1 Tax=Cohnella soli TaxID=425005 RepID=A0ABW0I1U5_9BACL